MKTRDPYTALAYEISLKGNYLHLAHNGSVEVADVPAWGLPLAKEATTNGDVILAEALIKALQ